MIKKIYAISVIATLCLLSSLTNSIVLANEDATTITTKPDGILVSEGQVFEIELYVEMARELDVLTLEHIYWNKTIANCIEIKPGDIFESYIAWIGDEDEINNDEGFIRYIVIGTRNYSKENGIFATIVFEATSAGNFNLNIPPGHFTVARNGTLYPTEILSYSVETEQQKEKNKENESEEQNQWNESTDIKATVQTKPNSFEVNEGDIFSVEIVVELNTIINAFAVDDIRWDPSLVTLNGKPQRGDLFEESTIWIAGKEIDEENGIMKFTAWGSQQPTTTGGVFARLNFTALKDGLFELYIHPDYVQGAYTEAGGETISIIPKILGNPNDPSGVEEKQKEKSTVIVDNLVELIVLISSAAILAITLIIMIKRKKSKESIEKKSELVETKEETKDTEEKEQKKEIVKDKKKKIKYQKAKS
jgi:hypothetical protein